MRIVDDGRTIEAVNELFTAAVDLYSRKQTNMDKPQSEKVPQDLHELADQSLLPLRLNELGDDQPLLEVILCIAMSGGANYQNDMPAELQLARVLADGTEYQARYRQVAIEGGT